MAEQPLYGAFGDIETTNDEDNNTFNYGVYQLEAQKPKIELGQLQNFYGTKAMPIFEWVKTIQTGERTYDPNDFEEVL